MEGSSRIAPSYSTSSLLGRSRPLVPGFVAWVRSSPGCFLVRGSYHPDEVDGLFARKPAVVIPTNRTKHSIP